MSFCGLLLVFGISAWLPTIMQTSGYSLGSSLLQTAAMWVGAGVGMVVGGRVADAFGAKPVVATAFLLGCVSLLIMSTAPSLAVLYILMFVSGLGFIGSQVLTNAYIVTAYPENLRGPAIGWALSIGRLGAIVGPLLGGVILSSGLQRRMELLRLRDPCSDRRRRHRAGAGGHPLPHRDHHRVQPAGGVTPAEPGRPPNPDPPSRPAATSLEPS